MKGWRTILLNVVAVALFVLQKLFPEAPPVDPATGAVALGIANIVMRTLTNTPVGRKE